MQSKSTPLTLTMTSFFEKNQGDNMVYHKDSDCLTLADILKYNRQERA